MLDTNWQELYKAALLEIDPTKLVTRIQAAQRAIVQQESRTDVAKLERGKLADAHSMLKSLSRIASEGKRAASEALHPQLERLG